MLKSIKQFFDQSLAVQEQDNTEHRLKVATAALLIEMMQQDEEQHDSEHQAIINVLQTKFELTEQESYELFSLAREELANATDYFQFTRLIAENYTQEQKIKVIEYLWAIAYADGELDPYEELMVRRIAELIYVSHADYIRAKLKYAQ